MDNMNNIFYGYRGAIINSIAAVMRALEYDSDRVKAVRAILSVADPAYLPLDLYSFGRKEEK